MSIHYPGPASAAFEQDWRRFDREHLWHPYSSLTQPITAYPVASASGTRIRLEDGRELIDGMASWWSAIHGYNHPVLNAAVRDQLDAMAHVMFGGLTHRPAARLGATLLDITPEPLQHVFFADSGSVSVEVAIKMALQYWFAQGHNQRNKLLTIRAGYHGDTFGAMSVCDPVGGMHHLFTGVLPQHLFARMPDCRNDEEWRESQIVELKQHLEHAGHEIAAVILEPVVQGAGGMRFYCPEFLRRARALCDAHDVLLIFDEIATGFGRTGELFAMHHADVVPDILCLGKALTGGYMTLAATLCNARVAEGISNHDPGVFMHGPTFMANPLACSVAQASLELLLESDWKTNIARIESALETGLSPCRELEQVRDVRVLGAIGVVELIHPVDMHTLPEAFVQRGVWVRPFRNLVYVMPPYIISDDELATLTGAMCEVVRECC
ncbi:adenosylmethionine-8-amino-7-oxononanoate aminotransferase [Thiohalobacter sp. COW1]|uniref:adenosylmethionine--8-amino-7-oxononanoate transaminase n=1 Tax=Thiohalobacter sp. COW1 TaxID=2795687 RepID=UPI0019160117|nr:adenosylmethionine--8-amino-7-oxononanoate transaminase [Thiohalobacter sp. COW1]BCO30751.1 adenosylmethionine-8-amino-7-oxononanoate aminotransferase [Thiohalobacter sp. COW1]